MTPPMTAHAELPERTTPMNSLEKAARAACIADGHDPDVTCDVFTGDPADSFAWGAYRKIVRAVLLAVREPTDEMATAFEPFGGSKGLWSDPDEYREWYGDRVDFGTSWADAIDAILSPTDGGER